MFAPYGGLSAFPRPERIRWAPGYRVAGVILLLVSAFSISFAPADEPRVVREQQAPRDVLRASGIDGTIVLVGGQAPDSVLQRFVELAGGKKASLVVITTAREDADKEDDDKNMEAWKARRPASVARLHARSRQTADEAAFVAPLRQANAVWLDDGNATRLTDTYLGTAVEKELTAVLRRGGVIGGAGATARVLGSLVDPAHSEDAKIRRGFGLLLGTVIAPHFGDQKQERRLFEVLNKNPGFLGLGIDDGAALIIRGRTLRVLGDGTATACLAACMGRSARRIAVKATAVQDLTALRRAAIARGEPPFPPKEAPNPEVANGSLVIVGGGGMPAEVTRKFIELAGGPESLIVVLPTANPDPIPEKADAGFLERAGARNVQILRGREPKDVEDLKALETLKKAKGIWFGGGRQWRFVDAYEGTKAHDLFRDVLRRGGVIGGSSAGATIQGDYLCRGSPLNNTEMMSEGYERGLGFLPGVAIDQHFTQRKRFEDMTALMKTYPQLLGIGIDEGTAILVQGHVAEVMGRNQVHFYDRNKPVAEGKPDYEVVKPGGRYDLQARKILSAEGQR